MTALKNSTILMIDDNEDDQHINRRALKGFDYDLVQVPLAQTGLAYLADTRSALNPSTRPDLILLDYNLPDMDGLEVMKRLAQYPDMHIPVIMLTSEGNEAVAVEAIRNGADDYIVKDTAGRYLKLLPVTIERVKAAHAQREHAQLQQRETQTMLLRNQTLMKNSMDGIHIMDMQGNLVEANDAFCHMLGYTQQEMDRLNVADWNAQWSAEKLQERFKGLIGKSARFETVHRRKDGKLIDVEISATGMQIGPQQLFFAASRDISERKRVDATLKQHDLVIETSIDGFWVADMRGNLLEANEAYAKMSGYPVDELVNMHISQLEAIELSPEAVHEHIAQLVEQGSERFDTRHRHKDGHEIDIEVSVTYMPEQERFFVFCRDITERRKNIETMRVAAVTFESHEGIVIANAHANIIRVNKAFTEISGYSPEEVLGKNTRIMNSGQHDKEFYIDMWECLLRTGSWSGEILGKRKDGQIYPKWQTITAVKNEHDQITMYVSIFSDITARKKVEEEIRNMAFYDVLTRLPNRRLFLDRLRAALPVSARHNDYGAVLFIDLDRFKTLNDTLGHDFGDMLLKEVAARIKSCVREVDTVARLGGDEFVVLIEGLSESDEDASYKVGQVGEKIRESLTLPYQLKQHIHLSSPSIGISLYHGTKESVDDLLKHADMAMYHAKQAGRNGVRFFDCVMQHDVEEHAALENDLRHAIEQRQLHLHYQIQVDNDNQPVGAEALLRWMHPQRGCVMPDQFISLAEKSTLILEIGHWVLEAACRQLALWSANEQTRELTLAVNISIKQFVQPEFVDIVSRVLKENQINPARLKLELTESMLLNDLDGAVKKMQMLKSLGVSLSMDDFGTRYSSLSYLKRLPLDQIKLGRDFVQMISSDGNDALLVQNIINLVSNSRLNVIAEWVETESQLALLKHSNCSAYQGFLFSRALPISEFEALLESGVRYQTLRCKTPLP